MDSFSTWTVVVGVVGMLVPVVVCSRKTSDAAPVLEAKFSMGEKRSLVLLVASLASAILASVSIEAVGFIGFLVAEFASLLCIFAVLYREGVLGWLHHDLVEIVEKLAGTSDVNSKLIIYDSALVALYVFQFYGNVAIGWAVYRQLMTTVILNPLELLGVSALVFLGLTYICNIWSGIIDYHLKPQNISGGARNTIYVLLSIIVVGETFTLRLVVP